MVLNFDPAWHTSQQRSVVTPIVLIRIMLDQRRVLRVYDGTLGTGETITVDGYALVGGTDFSVGSPNSATALAIAQAFNAEFDADPAASGVRAFARGDDVYFVGGRLTPAFTVASTEPTFAAEVSTPPTDATFVSGDTPLFGYPCCVSDLASASMTIDPFTRGTTVGAMDIEFCDDGQAIRELVDVGYVLYLQRVEVLVGVPSLNEGDFALLGTYVIGEWLEEEGKITLQCRDAAEEGWKNRTINGAWIARHPLQIVEDIMVNYVEADDIVDLTTLDPADYDDISHFVVSRYHDLSNADSRGATGFGLDNAIVDDRKVTDVLEQLLFMCGGSLIPDNTGLYGYRHFDITAGAVRIWQMGRLGEPGEGFDCDRIEKVESVGKIINRVKTSLCFIKSTDQAAHFAQADQQSYNVFGRLVEEVLDLLFCNGYVQLKSGTFPKVEGSSLNSTPQGESRIFDDSTRFSVYMAGRQGFCGARYDWNGSSFDLADGCTLGGATGRYCILKLIPPGRITDGDQVQEFEYIAVDEWLLDDDAERDESPWFLDNPSPYVTRASIADSAVDELDAMGFGTQTVYGRGGFGTTTPGTGSDDYWQTSYLTQNGSIGCVDVTIPIAIVQRLLRRFRFGAPRIRTRTSLEHMDLELGDFISILGDDVYIGHQRVGLNSDVVWEIVGKNVDVMSDSPGIVWDLVFVSDSGQATIIPLFDPPIYQAELEPVPISIIDNYAEAITVDGPPTAGSEVDFLQISSALVNNQIISVDVTVSAYDVADPTENATWTGHCSAVRVAGNLVGLTQSFTKTGSAAIANDPEFVEVGAGQLWLRAVGTDSLTIQWRASFTNRTIAGP